MNYKSMEDEYNKETVITGKVALFGSLINKIIMYELYVIGGYDICHTKCLNIVRCKHILFTTFFFSGN